MEILFILLGAIVVALLTPTALVVIPRRWWRVVMFVSFGTVAVNLVVSFLEAKQPSNNLLVRDVVGWVVLAGIAPLLTAAVARSIVRSTDRIWIRTAATWLVAALLAGGAPCVMLIVHCTSGDCLLLRYEIDAV